jgi:hypothetical protein
MLFRALLCVSSPLATISFKWRSSAFITSSALFPWNGASHGPPICLHVIVFISITSFGSVPCIRFLRGRMFHCLDRAQTAPVDHPRGQPPHILVDPHGRSRSPSARRTSGRFSAGDRELPPGREPVAQTSVPHSLAVACAHGRSVAVTRTFLGRGGFEYEYLACLTPAIAARAEPCGDNRVRAEPPGMSS